MKRIELSVYYGDELKHIEVSNPYGGGGGYHVYINRYYNGTIVKLDGKWVGHLNLKSDLQTADIDILGELIDARYPEDEVGLKI